ncbi:gluconate 2-dehydrogenase subunit 3 family protein [uncultured Algibacter sp.]|uniref:gluconate 2-dehydrogenase subunit 3 family protein n=1 Tax=uncultured Algibacter sp. TaxID=298659 RepID=UPI0026133E5E|nr:gluconate 2-dehydrogenase subunit 3 family protein [uncultured Algibacter sp.]
MDRRTALKQLSIGLGYAVATPTILNIVSSCSATNKDWKPLFLSSEEKYMVTHLTDIILPTTDTPGALDVNVPQFIDMIYNEIEQKANQNLFKKGALVFSKLFKTTFDLEAKKGKKAQFETLLTSLFKLSKKATTTILQQQSKYLETLPDLEKDHYMLYKFLIAVRRYTLLGYFTSEKIGEDVLNYDPVPGQQLGCIPLENVPNGHTWSFQRW